MVSGLATSPCDQLRILSGEARLMRMASKSATAFPKSKGLERYKVSSTAATHAHRQRLLVSLVSRTRSEISSQAKSQLTIHVFRPSRLSRHEKNSQRETLIG